VTVRKTARQKLVSQATCVALVTLRLAYTFHVVLGIFKFVLQIIFFVWFVTPVLFGTSSAALSVSISWLLDIFDFTWCEISLSLALFF